MSDGIAALARKHRIADRDALALAMNMAGHAYDGARQWAAAGHDDDAPDTLDKIDKPVRAVLALLDVDINLQRLVDRLAASGTAEFGATVERCAPVPGGDRKTTTEAWLARVGSVGDEIDHVLRCLDAIRLAARAAHRTRRRGRPKDAALHAAYGELADFWRSVKGDDNFTQGWEQTTEEGLAPITPAACFIYDAMKIVAPGHAGLAEALRVLMAETISGLRGPRRGRTERG